MRGLLVWLVRALALGALLIVVPVRPGLAVSAEPILGSASGETEEPGTLTPIGNGRFATQDRVYGGKILARSVVEDWSACFNGQFTSREDWSLEATKMAGTHESLVVVRADRATVTLQLKGQMQFPNASGTWEIVQATGPCAGLDGEGRYTATFSNTSPEFRLTFEGLLRK